MTPVFKKKAENYSKPAARSPLAGLPEDQRGERPDGTAEERGGGSEPSLNTRWGVHHGDVEAFLACGGETGTLSLFVVRFFL